MFQAMNRQTAFFYFLFILLTSAAVFAQRRPAPAIDHEQVPGYGGKGIMLEWSTLSQQQAEPDVPAGPEPPAGLYLRWLGVAGFELSDDSTTILIDPFVSRPALQARALFARLQPDTQLVSGLLLPKEGRRKIRAVLVSHAHYDHVFDVPLLLELAAAAGHHPIVLGDANVAAAVGTQTERMRTLDVSAAQKLVNGQKVWPAGSFGAFTIHVIASDHPSYDHLPGVLLDGRINGTPKRMLAFKTRFNTTLQWLITYKNLRILFSETPVYRHPQDIGPVDILVQGIASRLDRQNLIAALENLQPRYLIPSHFDDFFKPLSQMQQLDYRIGTGADFARLPEFIEACGSWYFPQMHKHSRTRSSKPALRMMAMFRYYALDNLLAEKRK